VWLPSSKARKYELSESGKVVGVEHGLFIGMAAVAVIAKGDKVLELQGGGAAGGKTL
jgi:hypothetical protein